MKKMFVISMVLAASTVWATSSQAQGRLDKIKETGEITIGHRESSIPFSYLDDNQKPVGYSLDICAEVIESLKNKLNLPTIKVTYVPVTASTRIPLVSNGTIDLTCGSSTNTAERQAQVDFTPTTFVTATRFTAKKESNLSQLSDLKGKTVVSTAGSSNIRWLTSHNDSEKLDMRIIPTKDHAEAFLTVENGRALAFFMDDVLLASLVATARKPDDWVISEDAYTVEPYAIMQPKNDPAFKDAVDTAIKEMMANGTLETIYNKWFLSPIPPKNVNLNLPMSAQLKRAIANPTDSPDPTNYQ